MSHISHARTTVLATLTVLTTLSLPARADILLSLESPITAQPNTTGDAFDVLLTNTGPSVANIASFSFGITTSDTDITFTDANTLTVANSYIFAGDSFDVINGFGLATASGAQTLEASDASNSGLGANLASGATVGIGHVLFDVAAGAKLGSAPLTFEVFPTTSLSDSNGANVGFTATPGTINVATTAVPEPSTIGLLFCALTACAFVARRRQT